jgi:AraC-like DNA-binding protein
VSSSTYAIDTTWRTLCKDLGVEPADVLRRAALPEDLLRQPTARLAQADYYRLWRGLESELDDPLLAIRICERVRSESFSPLLFAALCSPDLLVAAKRIAHYKALIAPVRFEVAETDDRVAITLTWPDDPAPPTSLVMMELLFCVTLARIGTRERVRPVSVVTVVPPDPAAPYEEFLGAPLSRGPAPRVTFAIADARRPFLTSNGGLWTAFEPELRARLADLTAPASTARRVRAALLEGIPSGLVTVDAVARRLAVSTRTLQRQIHAEGTTYQRILHETRESLARHYLERTSLPASEISFLLGFDEPNSFARAFKGWTGATPDAVRRQSLLVRHPSPN